ncbi:Quorum-quenching protein AidA [Ruegeria sp. THAF57]|uniref:alpha/beta hydrolase n=1 Tax=Ruegeria sp. THAF57 TaxID=2744555 RepID=UPI0015DFFCEC|nr:alpha/beta hydrolase [Ruegeria sp. THAF57]CAD0187189.1 Quorum-quenching protein AidA [Ruegeria sp. THAF57]
MTMQEVMVPVGDGVELHTWVFKPEGFDGPRPAISMAHGFGGVKYRGLRNYAEKFAAAGFVVTVHDHRGFGLSGGVVRGDIDPWQQIADWKRVISYVETIDGVDTARIGLWGSSYAGGHAIVLGATDRRLKAIVSQVPTISGYLQGQRRVPPEYRAALEERFNADERAQFQGQPPAMQLMLSMDPQVPAAYKLQEAQDFKDTFPLPEGIPSDEMITFQSSRKAMMYEPGNWIKRISPTPVLMVVATRDVVTPTDLALDAYEQLLEPKRLQMYDGNHFEAYAKDFDVTAGAATEWFVEHLRP